jgi:hypothetical protein
MKHNLSPDATLVDLDLQYRSVTAGELEVVIDQLCELRAGMSPEVPHAGGPTRLLHGALDPKLHIGPAEDIAGVDLALCHPGSGWILFRMRELQVRSLARALMDALPPQSQRSTLH